jgi:hypothetical protein
MGKLRAEGLTICKAPVPIAYEAGCVPESSGVG